MTGPLCRSLRAGSGDRLAVDEQLLVLANDRRPAEGGELALEVGGLPAALDDAELSTVSERPDAHSRIEPRLAPGSVDVATVGRGGLFDRHRVVD